MGTRDGSETIASLRAQLAEKEQEINECLQLVGGPSTLRELAACAGSQALEIHEARAALQAAREEIDRWRQDSLRQAEAIKRLVDAAEDRNLLDAARAAETAAIVKERDTLAAQVRQLRELIALPMGVSDWRTELAKTFATEAAREGMDDQLAYPAALKWIARICRRLDQALSETGGEG